MPTMFNGGLQPDCMSASNIRAWAAWVESVLTTIGGWTVTTDAGQTLPSALGVGTAINQKLGYRMYQMNDAFTTDNPIYMRVDYGTGNDNPLYKPGLWFSFGRGTDGAGVLTTVLWDGRGVTGAPGASTLSTNTQGSASGAFVTRSYASADHSRFVICLFVEPLGQSTLIISVERSRDASGAYTADGLMVCHTDIQSAGGGGITQTLSTAHYLPCNGVSIPPMERSISWIYPTQSPSALLGGAAPVAMITHFMGFAQQPGMQIVLTARGNISSEGQLLTHIYGADRLYQNLGAVWAARPSVQQGNFNDAGIGVCLLWE